ncbi:MAG TPA: hypothetical protein VGL09_02615 [Methylomirabilota bacterium]|jgi:hypothetical protein
MIHIPTIPIAREAHHHALTLLVAAALLGAGCSEGRLVVPVNMNPTALAVPIDGRHLNTHEAAVRGISALLVRDLGLPVPDEVMVYVYDSREVFERGLIHDAHIAPARAAELSDFAMGVGKRRQLLLYDATASQGGREWLRLIAHELTHVAQFELAGGEGRAEQWLAEGMAEWVAFTVLERLGLDTVNDRRAVAMRSIRRQAAFAAGRLDLDSLGTPRGFTVRHLREGSLATYRLAFLMADYLIERDGFPRMVDYFRACAQVRDRHGNFTAAFGQTLAEFEAEVTGHLTTLVN